MDFTILKRLNNSSFYNQISIKQNRTSIIQLKNKILKKSINDSFRHLYIIIQHYNLQENKNKTKYFSFAIWQVHERRNP